MCIYLTYIFKVVIVGNSIFMVCNIFELRKYSSS